MSNKLFLAGAATLALGMVPQAANAVTISTTYESNGQLPGYTTAQVIQSFDSYSAGNFTAPASPSLGAGITQSESGNNLIKTVASGPSGTGVPPAAAVTNYLSIHSSGNGENGGGLASYTLNFANPVQFMSFVFGTLDTYNSVRMTFSNGDLLTLTGAQIAKGVSSAINDFSGLSGGVGVAQGRASYNMNGGPGLTSISFRSTDQAFEIDSIAVAAPEPATWAMMLLGFGVIGTQVRRRKLAQLKRQAAA